MAQVLAPIAQTSGSITMLHTSPDAYQNQPTQPHQQQSRTAQMPRSQMYNAQAGGAGYRGTSAPIAPYAFSQTPQLRQDTPQLRPENRSSSAPTQHTLQQPGQPLNPARHGHPSHPSSSSDSTVSTSGSSNRSSAPPVFSSKDESETRNPSSQASPATSITLSTTVPDLSLTLLDAPVKPSPDRYRRGPRRGDSSTSGTSSSATLTPGQVSPALGNPAISGAPILGALDLQGPPRPGHNRASSVDDMQLPRSGGSVDPAKRYRRRSLSGLDVNAMAPSAALVAPGPSQPPTGPTKRPTQELRPPSSSSRHGSRPTSSHSHERHGSSGSVSSSTSNRPSSRQESHAPRLAVPTAPGPSSKSAHEASRRLAPSPLSNPISPSESNTLGKQPVESTTPTPSAAVQRLTALNDKEGGKGMKSRLRRAFSFGSAAELRRASAENNLSAERAKLRKDRYQHDQDLAEARVVAQQEAAGIGAGIYTGQGGFSGSTDNLSISSTASSASIMLRKMGSGMKKGSRSIKGLFRPKSVIGVPAADGPITQPSVGQVSMVTVEAERQKVNVNLDPHEQTGGGTGYPRLERNSIDAGRNGDVHSLSPAADPLSRKSIVGGERERAEVLSSIKRGILKRSGTNSPTSSPTIKPIDAFQSTETPKSSAPTTPNNELGQPLQVHTSGDDYFTKPARLMNPSTRSLPTTPRGSRNISFNPRIQNHEVWSALEYDRRGEIATCNRLTPMLAQQIKEELNSFKMEMEVHEQSKPHTHFF
ncbi:hypothetical protein BDV95DRAFT_488473 [Massariosphaeria phaeospora]|uniref:Protein BNI4 n=1 Tax=Massariosphaeria phaeospora TaxID=100035 RepID=A0A7C8IBR0_9PLEO|nr:hypothetical protein BDV95DRAFT_488473 [Massariosphaeria phaeospora]